ncbi:MAG: NUDIX hydrolase [Actinomycetes bacterium]
MLRSNALEVIAAYQGNSLQQLQLRERYLQFLALNENAMFRECVAGHLTGSALVFDPATDQVLLTHHRKSGRWLQFGGHCDANDPTLAYVAQREAVEESGLQDLKVLNDPVDLDEHELGPNFSCAPTHLDVRFLALASSSQVPTTSEESHDVRWFPAAAPEITDASLRRLIEVSRQIAGGR